MEGQGLTRAGRNWATLRNIIRAGKHSTKDRKRKWELFQIRERHQAQKMTTQYSFNNITLLQVAPRPTLNELLHFQSNIDATGKWLWEAEEIAAYYLLNTAKSYLQTIGNKQGNIRQRLNVIEIGAGCSGLAGIALKKIFSLLEPKINVYVELTDGQLQNIAFLEQNLHINSICKEEGRSYHMQWGDQQALTNLGRQGNTRKCFDIMIACDCLFFDSFHKELLLTMNSYLAEGGVILLFNPARGQSMKSFLELALLSGLQHSIINFRDERYQQELIRIRSNENFQEDRDLPFIIQLRHKSTAL